jgi:hypothetical protein
VYRRNGARESVAWRICDAAADWFRRESGECRRLEPDGNGRIQNLASPGLHLDVAALLSGDGAKLTAAVQAGRTRRKTPPSSTGWRGNRGARFEWIFAELGRRHRGLRGKAKT